MEIKILEPKFRIRGKIVVPSVICFLGMLAKAITGATLDRGWDTSYNICFPHLKHKWRDFPVLEYTPTLMQTIGKSIYYKWQTMKPENSKLDTDVSFEDMFKFIDE